jgi:hypothetical protein
MSPHRVLIFEDRQGVIDEFSGFPAQVVAGGTA